MVVQERLRDELNKCTAELKQYREAAEKVNFA